MSTTLLSAKVAAEQLNVSKKTLLKWCHEGRLNYIALPGKKHPGPYKFRQEAIDIFIARHEIKAINNMPVVRWKPPKKKAA
jgi:excisionase family DNA binding protein